MPRASILVIDDEPNILSSVQKNLQVDGYTVEIASNGAQGLAKLASHDIDLVLLDVMMPGETGLQLLPKIRAAHPEVMVVMMSGNATLENAVQATRDGAYDFLEKPPGAKLEVTVKNALEFGRMAREAARLRPTDTIVGKSASMKAIYDKVAKTAPTSGRVLITGENGTGKELVARALHDQSRRAKGPFVKVNCAAIPSELIESELFGHEKGSFTGATKDRRGKFEQADGGTLFLDEIGDMNPSAQAKVLRALQEGELERVGGTETIKVDVRVIAATNKDLPAEIAANRFREDLFYRLNVVPIEMPPLRARKDDIPALIEHFLALACARDDRRVKRMAPGAVTLMMQHDWPGNVRELKNVVERMVILTGDNDMIGEADVRDALPRVQPVKGHYEAGTPFKDLVAAAEREIILAALEAHDHHVSNTAKDLQLERSHLYKKMRALGIDHRAGTEEGD